MRTKHFDAISHTFRPFRFNKKFISTSIGPSSLIWLAKLLKPGVPVVFTFHTKCYEHQKWGRLAKTCLRLAERFACHSADKVITISQSLTNYAKSKHNIKSAFIPNGVSAMKQIKVNQIKKWGLEKDGYILAVTRLVGHKGVQYLIDAYKSIKTKKKLVIVGDGAYTDNYVKKLKESTRGNKNIIFTGNQVGSTLAELFSNAYLFVQPSESEGLSIALLEAMAYKKCVLVSDIRENTDVIKKCGVNFKNKNVRSLKIKLVYLLKHTALVHKYGLLAKAEVNKNYNWSKLVITTAKIYRQVLAEAANKQKHFFRLKLAQKIAVWFF